MDHDIDRTAYGIAAFAILKSLLPKLIEESVIAKSDLLTILDDVARQESARGVLSNSDADTGAARLAGTLAIALRHNS